MEMEWEEEQQEQKEKKEKEKEEKNEKKGKQKKRKNLNVMNDEGSDGPMTPIVDQRERKSAVKQKKSKTDAHARTENGSEIEKSKEAAQGKRKKLITFVINIYIYF